MWNLHEKIYAFSAGGIQKLFLRHLNKKRNITIPLYPSKVVGVLDNNSSALKKRISSLWLGFFVAFNKNLKQSMDRVIIILPLLILSCLRFIIHLNISDLFLKRTHI